MILIRGDKSLKGLIVRKVQNNKINFKDRP